MPELYGYIAISLISAALGFLIGCFVGIGSEKARIRNMEKTARALIEYHFHLKGKDIEPDKKVPRFPPGPLRELYDEKDIEEVLTSVNKSFPDRMKAAKAAKRKDQ